MGLPLFLPAETFNYRLAYLMRNILPNKMNTPIPHLTSG